jgi:hypothetical protein
MSWLNIIVSLSMCIHSGASIRERARVGPIHLSERLPSLGWGSIRNAPAPSDSMKRRKTDMNHLDDRTSRRMAGMSYVVRNALRL